MANEDSGRALPASELIGYDSSALSLDGRSLNIPNDGTDEDMSSLGTSKYGGYNFSTGNNIGYIGDMRIIGRAEEYDNEHGAPVPPYRSPTQSPYHHSGGTSAGDYDFQRTDYSVQTEERGGPTLVMDQKDEKEEMEKSGCLPAWIAQAPFWLKLVIICSTALLIGAAILIAVGASLATDSLRSSTGNQNPDQPPMAPSNVPVPVPPGLSTQNPTAASSDSVVANTSPPVAVTTIPPTMEPTASPSNVATGGTSSPTSTSTETSSDTLTDTLTEAVSSSTTVNFFAMGGRFDDEALAALTDDLQTLPNIDGNAVMFHLGDWNSPYATSCVESSYTRNVEVYQQSSIPVYFVPGDNEFNDCPNPDQAFSFWYEHILGFETQFWPEPAWNITRQTPAHPENFAFLQKNVLFVGINLVGGIVHDQEEWTTRHEDNLQWVNETVASMDGKFETLVILSHADPDIEINGDFFAPFYTMVQAFDEKVIYVHRNLGIDSWQIEPSFNGISNLDVVVVEGSLWPPMWIQIDTETRSFSIDQGTWFQDFQATGVMPASPPQ